MTDERLAELERLWASPTIRDDILKYIGTSGKDPKEDEAKFPFIVAARTAMPELLAEVRRLRDYHRLTRETILAINLYHQHELGNDLAHRIAELWNRCRCL